MKKKKVVSVSLSLELADRIEQKKTEAKMTRSMVVTDALEKYFYKKEEDKDERESVRVDIRDFT